MTICQCGCGEDCNARFRPGHDARHKSRLFAAARSGDAQARAEITSQGWDHLFDKSIPRPAKPAREMTIKQQAALARAAAREARPERDPEESSALRREREERERLAARAKLDMIMGMKLAAALCKDRGVRLQVTRDNYQAINEIGPAAVLAIEEDRMATI